MSARFTKSKSIHDRMNVVAAMPAPANANADEHRGRQREHRPPRAHQPDDHHRDEERGRVERAAEQRPRRSRRARRRRRSSGVASIASKVCAYLNLKKKLNVVSSTAPFIAAAAISPGATNWSYGIGSPPGPGTFPTSPPTPMPIDSR